MKLSKVDVLKAALEGKKIQARWPGEDWQNWRGMSFEGLLYNERVELRLKPKTETKNLNIGEYGLRPGLKPNIKITFKDGEPISAQIIKGEVK
jgi:hypothetical protein